MPVSRTTDATPKSVDTSNWITHRNDKYGFEIKYPKGVEVIGNENTAGISVRLDNYFLIPKSLQNELASKARNTTLLGAGVSMIPFKNSKNISIKDWVIENVLNGSDPGRDMKESELMFAGEPAYRLEVYRIESGSNLFAVDSVTTYFFHNGYVFEIGGTVQPNPSLGPVTEEWKSHPYYKYLEQSVPITDAIINSFRLIK